jgi:predicted transcriptional regulator
MRVEEVMSTPVVITQRNVKITHIKDQLSRKGIHALPVLEEDGTITGIVTSSDVAKHKNDEDTVGDIMSDRVHIVLKNNRLKDAAAVMTKHAIHHLIVMEDGDVVGMISSMDIVAIYAES